MLDPQTINGLIAIGTFIASLFIAYGILAVLAWDRRKHHPTRESFVREIVYSAIAFTFLPAIFMIGCALHVFVISRDSYLGLAEKMDEFPVWSAISIVTLAIGFCIVAIANGLRR